MALTAASVRMAGVAAVIAIAALWPIALNAHGAGTLRHDLAVDAQAAHLLGVAVWAVGSRKGAESIVKPILFVVAVFSLPGIVA